MNKITIKNPSSELMNQIAVDFRKALDREIDRTFKKAINFIGQKGNKTFRSNPLTITIENDFD